MIDGREFTEKLGWIYKAMSYHLLATVKKEPWIIDCFKDISDGTIICNPIYCIQKIRAITFFCRRLDSYPAAFFECTITFVQRRAWILKPLKCRITEYNIKGVLEFEPIGRKIKK